MSEAIKPTPGEWIHGDWIPTDHNTAGWVEVWTVDAEGNLSLPFVACKHLDAGDNARLIAEAGTVFHETQCTPRQLVERVKELEGALRDAVDCGMVPKSSAADGGASKYSAQVLVADRIRAALSKALPNAAAKEAGK